MNDGLKEVLLSTFIIGSFIGVYIWAQVHDDQVEQTACIEVHAKLNRSESTILCGKLVKEN